MILTAVAPSAATPTHALKIPVGPAAVGTPKQRAIGYATVRTPPEWGRWSRRTGAFLVDASPTCALTIRVGAGLTSAASPIRQLNTTINLRNGENIVRGKTSSGRGVWGAQVYGPDVQFQLLGSTVVKLAARRMAQLSVQLTAQPGCQAADKTETYYSPLKHMLRTARFHLRLKKARPATDKF